MAYNRNKRGDAEKWKREKARKRAEYLQRQWKLGRRPNLKTSEICQLAAEAEQAGQESSIVKQQQLIQRMNVDTKKMRDRIKVTEAALKKMKKALSKMEAAAEIARKPLR
jgi:hypothetical protein